MDPAVKVTRGSVEACVRKAIEDTLQVAEVSPADDLFALGLDSLTATRIVVRIRHELDVELPVIAMFEHATVAEVVGAVEQLRGEPTEQPRVGGQPLSV